MANHAKIRALSLLVSSVLVLGTLGTVPAFADDADAPVVVTESTSQPDEASAPIEPEQTPDATPEPTPDATPEPTNATDEPDDRAEGDAGSGADFAVVANGDAQTVTLAGSIVTLSSESHSETQSAAPSTERIFHVAGLGYVVLDFSAIDPSLVVDGALTVSLEVPSTLDLSGAPDEKFRVLADYSLLGAIAVTTVDKRSASLKSLVNQTPATAAVHRIYAVLVTPGDISGTTAAPNQTAAKVQAAVNHVSNYWSAQSGGAVTFAYKGTVPHYKSSYLCASTTTGATGLWNQAAAAAKSSLGYVEGPNSHLVLFFPSSSGNPCLGPIGLATVGGNINAGGPAWVIGTDAPGEKSTLAHELGHNLSFGHANWADCTSATPAPGVYGTTGCTNREYSDIYDVMGFGVDGFTGGSLSSPQAIRSGLWPTTAYTDAPVGTTSVHTLADVGSYAGKRAVTLEDSQGVRYFVEFRNFAGPHDSQYSAVGCTNPAATEICMPTGPGVRILRMAQGYRYSAYLKGAPGDDSLLIGRTVGGVKKTAFGLNESFTTAGVTIKVTGLTATSATVSITRPKVTVSSGAVRIVGQSDWPWAAGETLTAHVGTSWKATKYSYTWYRKGKVIKGATKASYTLTGADVGQSIKVRVTGSGTGAPKAVTDPSSAYSGYGPIVKGTLVRGTVSISAGAQGLTAQPVDWHTPSTAFSYQWLRAGAAIKGATKATYVPTLADNGVPVSVRLAGSKSGYTTVTPVVSPTVTQKSEVSGTTTLTISGVPKVGVPLSVNSLAYLANGAAASPVTRLYQWYRSGVVIAGATAATYTPVAADFGKTITVRVIGGKSGFPLLTHTSGATGVVVKGTIAISAAYPVVTKNNLVLGAAFPAGALTEPGTVTTWQWLRDGAAIAKATKAAYTLTSTDYNKQISVRATVTKLNYDTVVRTSLTANHSLLASSTAPTIAGTPQVGLQLTAVAPTYSTIPNAGGATSVAYQWYRAGVVIKGATASSYPLVAADFGKKITVRTIGIKAGYLSPVGVSLPTVAVAKGIIAGSKSTATVTKNAAGTVLTADPTTGAITEPGVAYAYQWYRGGAAIAKATKKAYTLTAADRSKTLHVRIIVTKLNYTSVVLLSTPTDYSVIRSAAPSYTGFVRVGELLTVNSATYTTHDLAPFDPAPAYQWFRSGVAIPGATGTTYRLVAADYAKLVTVRVTATRAGYLPYVVASAATKVGLGVMTGPNVAPTVSAAGMTLTTTGGSVGEPGVVYGYQWFRSGVAIPKATKTSYTLTALDAGKKVAVRKLATKTAYTAVALLSVETNYSVQRTAAPVVAVLTGGVRVGGTVGVSASTYFTLDGPVGGSPTYQWYRNGVAITGQTSAVYAVTAVDLAKSLSVRVVASEPGYLPYVVTTAAVKVAPGVIATAPANPPVVNLSKDDETLVVTAALPAGSVTEPGAKVTWQWFRAGVAIPKATSATFRLSAVDYNKVVTARATVTKAAYTTLTVNSAPVNSSVVADSAVPVITGNVAVNLTLGIAPRGYTNGGSETRQWLRAGVDIPGAIGATYTLTPADKGKAISVRVRAGSYGFLPSITTSAPTQLVGDFAMAGGSSTTAVPAPKQDGVLPITASDTVVTEPGTVKAHQWYRSGVAIAKATAATYTPVVADFGKLISVRVFYTKPGYTSVVRWSTGVAVSVVAAGKPTISSTLPKRGKPVTVSTPTFSSPEGNPITVTYQWYRNGTAISGATAATYKPVTADKGKKLTARVVAASVGLVPAVLMSAATKALK